MLLLPKRPPAAPETGRREDLLAAAPATRRAGRAGRVWTALWPRLLALMIALGLWQAVVWSHWRPDYVLPGPLPVFRHLVDIARDGTLLRAVAVTIQRALVGYAIAFVIGVTLGLALARIPVLRTAAGSLVAGLQSMPSVAWFPLAILLFKLTEGAILFVVVLGAAPAIAIGLMSAIDHVPPLLIRAGRVLDARGLALYRHVVLPAALPGFVAGLKQGWAFAWRSLMAGELLVIIAHRPSVGERMQFAREFADAEGLLAWMAVILALGVLVDACVFGPIERTLRAQRGLIETADRP